MERSPDAFAARLERRLRSTETPPAAPAFASVPAAGDIEALVTAAEESAAVTGRFDPDAIVRNIQGPTRVAILSRLASCSVVEVEGKATKWRMQSDRRSDVLKRLVQQRRLDKKLAEPLPDTDRFGQKLRDVLRGSALTVGGLSREDLLATSAAIEATDGLDIARPDESAVRGSIAQLEFLADYTVLLEDGFIGREQELRDLNAFLTDASPVPASPPWTGLVLTGLGGAGKSTLLAKLATDAVNARTATVVALDFDHPGIEPDDTSWLEMEITRQVSCQHPETGQELRALRQNTRLYKAEFSEQVASFAADAGSYGRSLRGLLFDLQRVLKSSGAANLPLLLVLDTFEEVTQRDLESRTIDWLSEVAERLWPIRLKVIFSGRLFGPSRDLLKKHGITRVIEIDQLDPPLAEQLLLRNHVPPEWAKRLANSDVLPRRPLELKLLARLVTGPDAPSIDELERELRSGGDAAQRLFAGLVYRRVLLRINDATTQTLAYPGLVLRYVTADLIKKVLAPALDLPPMDDTQARDALKALAGYDWLAYRGPNDEVWHRSDLRRSVLQAMIAQEPAKAARIHEEAIKHFASGSTPKERAEGTYHRLMQTKTPADGETFELKDLQEASEFIGADAVDLPPAAAALMRLGSGQELSVSDVALLPSRHLPRAYSGKGKHLVDDREFGRALRLYLDVHATGLLAGIPIDAWETETLFATASWRAPTPDPKPPLPPLRSAVFPDALIDPNRVQTVNVDAQLRNESGVRSLLRDSNASTIVERLAMGLVLLNAHRPLSGDQKGPLRLLLKLARSEMKTIPPVLEKRLLFLDVIVGEEGWPQRSVRVTPITIVINRDSLDALDAAAAREAGPDSDALRALVLKVRDAQAQSVSGRWTVRSMLGTINGLATHITTGDPRVRLANLDRRRMLPLLYAPVPEFRDPSRFALLEAFTDADGYRLLGGIVASIVGLKLDDLEPDAFVAAVSADPEHTLETYVEAVDRAAALGDLLAQARTARPEAQKLVDVEAAYRRWTGAVEQLFMERA